MGLRNKLLTLGFAFTFLFTTACGAEKTSYTNEIDIEIPGLSREYNYFLLNDMHINILNDETIPEMEEECANRNLSFAYDSKYPYENYDLWLKNLDTKHLDGIIFNADMVDQLSEANLTYILDEVNETGLPHMYLQSDHDTVTDWTAPSEENWASINKLREDNNLNQKFYTFEEEDFIILGMNYTHNPIDSDELIGLKEVFSKNKPIIIVTHVPYDTLESDELRNLSRELKGDKVLVWSLSGESYYNNNSETTEFLNMVYADDSPVVAVIAAHLHTTATYSLNGTIPEYVMGTGYSGVRTILRIIPRN